ncbi:MAG: hypothetical protein NVSMB21_12020 [Vulcanimicrobiaceae bacterium]
MRYRSLSYAVLALALAACSGGGGGPATPEPTATPVPPPARPATNGATFAYAGTLRRTFVRNPEPGVPQPAPVQTNSQTFDATVAQNVTVATGATYGGTPNLTDFKTVESDVQASPAKTTGIVTDAYESFPTGAGVVRAFAIVSTTSDGATFVTTFGADNGLVDVLPEIAGPLLPANAATATTTETDPDGTVTKRQTSADGSYVETSSYPDGTSARAVEAADGTGTYSLPLFGVGTTAASPTTPNTVFSVGAIVPAAPPAPAYVPIHIVYAPGVFAATAVTADRKVADWYPSLAPAPPVLSSETYANHGLRPIPAACAVSPSVAPSGNELVQTIAKTDTLFGETETQTTTTYLTASGVACTVLGDTVTQYYDFTGQTRRSLATASTPLQSTITTETVGLRSQSPLAREHASGIGRSAASAVAPGVFPFTASLERRRLQRHAAFRRSLGTIGATR